MSRGHSNTVLVADLLRNDGPFTHIADRFVAARCAGCDAELQHDARHGEWGSFCKQCWPSVVAGSASDGASEAVAAAGPTVIDLVGSF